MKRQLKRFDIVTMIKHVFYIFLSFLLFACSQGEDFSIEDVIKQRPRNKEALFDHVGLMDDARDATNRHLANIREQYGIEMLIVTLPSLGNRYTATSAAVEIFTNWKIGKDFDGRGLLFLLVDDEKEVKIEVSYDLEDVFTDAFTGRVQDLLLQTRFAADQLSIGLIAVIEAIEARAQVKYTGDYTPSTIAGLDLDFLSQGAGAGHRLTLRRPENGSRSIGARLPVNNDYPSGDTPDQAWQTMIRSWKEKVKDPYLGVYTAVTRLSYRDFANRPDASLEREYATYKSKPYTVRQDGEWAVIYFGRKTGWDNAPFLLCRTNAGWQFDIVHQRRFIRMGKSPHWGVEFSDYPHMKLLIDAFSFQGQDFPLSENDRYTIDRDGEIANRMLAVEERVDHDPDNPNQLLELGRLYTITAMSAKAIPILNKALRLDPDLILVRKYLAMAHVDAHYQYRTAKTHIDAYVDCVDDDPIGHNLSGYIRYRQKDDRGATKAFERALAIDPDNCYAHVYLTYTYARRYLDASAANPGKGAFLHRFDDHKEKALALASDHPIRIMWLKRWLEGN